MKNLNKLVWVLAISMMAFTACSDDEDEPKGEEDSIANIEIAVKDITASTAGINFPVLEDLHNYTVEIFDAEGNSPYMKFLSVGMMPSKEVVEGEVVLTDVDGLESATEYKVVVEGTKNILDKGVVTFAHDSVMFTTVAQ